MKKIWKLTSWHWRMVCVPYTVLCAVYAVQQLVLLILSAGSCQNLGYGMAELFQGCGQMPLFFVTFYLVALVAASATRIRERAQKMYTLYTMPFPRRTLWAAQFLLGFLMLIGFVAWQILLYMGAYFPVTLVSDRVTASMVTGTLPPSSLFTELNANPLMQLLLPIKAGSGLALLGLLLLTALQSACMACCHGLRRVAVSLTALFCTGAACMAFYVRYHLALYGSGTSTQVLLLVGMSAAMVLAVINMLQAARALQRAESA